MRIRFYIVILAVTGIFVAVNFVFPTKYINIKYAFSIHKQAEHRDNATPILDLYRINYDFMCFAEAVITSPLGRYLVFMSDITSSTSLVSGGRQVGISDQKCAVEQPPSANCQIAVIGLGGMRLLAWHKSEKHLFLIENDTTLIQISFLGNNFNKDKVKVLRVSISKDLAQTMIFIGSTAHDDPSKIIDLFNSAQSTPEKKGSNHTIEIGRFFQDDKFIGSIGEDRRHLSIIVSTGIESYDLPIKSFQAPSAKLVFNKTGNQPKLMFLDSGIEFLLDKNHITRKKINPFSNPIIESNSGTYIGNFDFNTVYTFDGNKSSTFLIEDIGLKAEFKSNIIKSISISKSGTSAVILKNVSGSKILYSKYHQISKVHHCSLLPQTKYQRKIFDNDLDIKIVDAGSISRSLPTIVLSTPNAKGTAVVMIGGPAGSLMNFIDIAAVRHLLAARFNIVLPAYSGVRGSGFEVGARLANNPLDQLQEDVDVLASYISDHFSVDRPIVYGESFGALPASMFHRKFLCKSKLILLAPLLKFRRPEQWIDSRNIYFPYSVINSSYQRKFENEALGLYAIDSREDLSIKISESYKYNFPCKSAYIIFGESDSVSKPEDMPEEMRTSSNVTLVPGGHDLISTREDVWDIVSNWLR